MRTKDYSVEVSFPDYSEKLPLRSSFSTVLYLFKKKRPLNKSGIYFIKGFKKKKTDQVRNK